MGEGKEENGTVKTDLGNGSKNVQDVIANASHSPGASSASCASYQLGQLTPLRKRGPHHPMSMVRRQTQVEMMEFDKGSCNFKRRSSCKSSVPGLGHM